MYLINLFALNVVCNCVCVVELLTATFKQNENWISLGLDSQNIVHVIHLNHVYILRQCTQNTHTHTWKKNTRIRIFDDDDDNTVATVALLKVLVFTGWIMILMMLVLCAMNCFKFNYKFSLLDSVHQQTLSYSILGIAIWYCHYCSWTVVKISFGQ